MSVKKLLLYFSIFIFSGNNFIEAMDSSVFHREMKRRSACHIRLREIPENILPPISFPVIIPTKGELIDLIFPFLGHVSSEIYHLLTGEGRHHHTSIDPDSYDEKLKKKLFELWKDRSAEYDIPEIIFLFAQNSDDINAQNDFEFTDTVYNILQEENKEKQIRSVMVSLLQMHLNPNLKLLRYLYQPFLPVALYARQSAHAFARIGRIIQKVILIDNNREKGIKTIIRILQEALFAESKLALLKYRPKLILSVHKGFNLFPIKNKLEYFEDFLKALHDKSEDISSYPKALNLIDIFSDFMFAIRLENCEVALEGCRYRKSGRGNFYIDWDAKNYWDQEDY